MKTLFNFIGKESRQWSFWKVFIRLKVKEFIHLILIPALCIAVFFILPIKIMERKDNIITHIEYCSSYGEFKINGEIYRERLPRNFGVYPTEKELMLCAVQQYIYYKDNDNAIYELGEIREQQVNKYIAEHKLKIIKLKYVTYEDELIKQEIELPVSFYVKRIAVLTGIYIAVFLFLLLIYYLFKINYKKAKNIYFKNHCKTK